MVAQVNACLAEFERLKGRLPPSILHERKCSSFAEKRQIANNEQITMTEMK
jgi:hypothetical protein